MSEYEDVLRAAAIGTVYVSRSTNLIGERRTVSARLVKQMERDGTVKRACSYPDYIILTGGRHYLENAYRERWRKKGADEGSPEDRADKLVSMLKSLKLGSARFVPQEQVVGISLEDWDKLLRTEFRKADGFPLLSTFARLAKKILR